MLATFAHRDIVDQLDISSRTLAFWCDEGVLSPESRRPGAGTGVRRRFAASEVEIAAILSELIRMRLPIGTMRDVAQYVRHLHSVPKMADPELRGDEFTIEIINGHRRREPLEAGILSNIVTWYFYFSARHRPENEQKILLRMAPTNAGWHGYAIDARSVDRKFEWCPERDGRLCFPSCIEVNLTKAFAPLHEDGGA